MTETPADFATRVAALVSDYDREDGPGLVVLVQKDGQDVFCGSYGMASLNFAVKNRRDTQIRIGSQSKQFTVLLALLLEAEGKLSMQDPVQRHFPGLDTFGHSVTLEHLARNSSGLRDHFQSMVLSGRSLNDTLSRAETLAMIHRQEALNFPPGSRALYSNSGFVLLSELIERLEGKSFDAVLQERICRPLGLTRTRNIAQDGLGLPGLAHHYCKGAEGWYALNWGLPIGGEGGIASTVDELMVWMANFDRPRVGTPEMMARMQTPQAFANGTPSGYGMGLLVQEYRGRRYIGHGGWVEGGRSQGGRFPDHGLAIQLLANCDSVDTMPLVRRIADAYFDTPAPTPLAFRDGRYREPGGPGVLCIRHHAGAPQMQTTGAGFESLDCASPAGAAREGGILTTHYRPGPEGSILAEECGEPLCYLPLPAGTPEALDISGRYALAGQGMTAEITTQNARGQMVVRSELGVLRCTLEAVAPDLWLVRPAGKADAEQGPWMAVLQRQDEDGVVLSSARNLNQQFRRLADLPATATGG